MGKLKDLTGLRIERLTVKKRDGVDKFGNVFWLCQCDCGKETRIRSNTLLNKKRAQKSCGCLSRLTFGESVKNNIISEYKKGAKQRNLCWLLSDEQVVSIFKKSCVVCGSPPKIRTIKHHNGGFAYTGIDRIDNLKGYTITNVQPMCTICNYFKRGLSQVDFFKHVRKIIIFQLRIKPSTP